LLQPIQFVSQQNLADLYGRERGLKKFGNYAEIVLNRDASRLGGAAMQVTTQKTYQFEGFTLDLARGCLRRADQEIELRPKSFETLRYLVENAGRLVSKDELTSKIWPDVVATDESLTRCVSDIRLALGDRERRLIKTVPRRGYRFAAAVSEATGVTPGEVPMRELVPNVRESLFEGHTLFGCLAPADIDALLSRARFEHYHAGRAIFMKGSPALSMMAVIAGRIKISAPAQDGREVVLGIIQEGQIFGEIAMILGDRVADARALSNCDLLVIDRRDFIPFLERHGELRRRFLRLLNQRLRQTDEQIDAALTLRALWRKMTGSMRA
jgi:DNA-binding winged helix-turn-helix (wHTH) protein